MPNVTPEPVDVPALKRILYLRHYCVWYHETKSKLPMDMEGSFTDVALYSRRQNYLGSYTIRVKRGSEGKKRGASPHRVFAVIGGREIPVGRLHQAKN